MLKGEGGCVTDSPLSVAVPFVVCYAALLNGGCGVCCDASCLYWVRRFALSCSFLYRPALGVFAVTALLVWVVSLCQGCVIMGWR